MLENDLNLSPQQQRILSHEIKRIKTMLGEDYTSDELALALDDLENMIIAGEGLAEGQLSAQLSLYPLRQASLSPCIKEALSILVNLGMDIFPGSMSTVISGKSDDLWAGLQKVFSAGAAHGELVMIVSISNACPKPDHT